MNAPMIPLYMILVSHICIYLPSPFIIDLSRIKDPDTPQLRYQLPYMLPLKILLVI